MRGCKRFTCLLAALTLILSFVSFAFSARADDTSDNPAAFIQNESPPGGAADSIDVVLIYTDDRYLIYDWEIDLPDAAFFVLECSIDDSESWLPNTEFPNDIYTGVFLYGTFWLDYLRIDKMLLEPETDYYFRIRYEQLVSNTIHVRVSRDEADSWGYELELVIPMFFNLVVLPVGSDLTGIELPDKIPCQYNWFLSTMCDVIWEDLSAVDVSQPGWTYIRGEIVPPLGFYKPPGFAAYYPIMLTEDGMEQELVEVLNMPTYERFLIVRKDDDIGGLSTSGQYEYITDNYLTGECTITWDFSGIDTSQTGRYQVHAETDLPVCFTIPQNLVEVAVLESDFIDLRGYSANILNQIFCKWFYQIEDYENIRLQYSIDDGPWQDTQAVQVDAGMRISGDIECRFNGESLSIYHINLEYQEIFIRLVYEDKPSNALCITLLDGRYVVSYIKGDRGGADQGSQTPPDIKQPAPNPENSGDDGASGGKRDDHPHNPPEKQPDTTPGNEDAALTGDEPGGQDSQDPDAQPPSYGSNNGDNNSPAAEWAGDGIVSVVPNLVPQTPPVVTKGASSRILTDISENAPQIVTHNAAQEDIMTEYSTANTFSISGLRLKEMLALTGETVLFEKQGVSVELSADFLAGIEVADSSRFTVRIEKGDNAFTLEISLDDVPLSALPPTAVYVPFSPKSGVNEENLVCFDVHGNEVSDAVYDPALQIARVEIQATGSYTIAERAAAVSPVSAQTVDENINGFIDGRDGGAVLSIIGITALIICVCSVLLLRRRAATVGVDG